jgi:hypothetical protein
MDRFDVLAVAGIVTLSIGLGMISVPLGVSVFGIALTVAGLLGSYGHSRRGPGA